MRETATDIFYEDVLLVKDGRLTHPTAFAKAKKIAARKAFRITIDLHLGHFERTVLTTDLTEEYVRLNLGE